MDFKTVLRDNIWQGISGVVAIMAFLWPESREFLLTPFGLILLVLSAGLVLLSISTIRITVRDWLLPLEWKSFYTGLLTGGLLTLILGTIIVTLFQSIAFADVNPQVRIYEDKSTTPQIIEGSHYKLKSETKYSVTLLNAGQSGELYWATVPEDFGVISYDANSNQLDHVSAEYVTPKTDKELGGLIKICEIDENNQCLGLKIPDVAVVVSPE